MTTIYQVGPGLPYPSIAAALAVVAGLGQPLTDIQVIQVIEGIALADISVPGGIQPTASFPLSIVNVDFQRPAALNVSFQNPFTRVSGFDIQGNVAMGADGQMLSENKIEGQVVATGDGVSSWALKILNNAISGFQNSGILLQNLRGAIRVLFNTIFTLQDSNALTFGIDVEESDAELRYNILQAEGITAFGRNIRLKNTTGRIVTAQRNLYWLKGAALFGQTDLGAGAVDRPTFVSWQAATAQDSQSFFEDPILGCTDGTPIDLKVANDSPAVAAGDLDADVQFDIEKTRRPKAVGVLDSTTLGAYEMAERVTNVGKTRLLQLIAGLSTQSVTMAAVGDKGTISSLEYLQPITPSGNDTDLAERYFQLKITNRSVVGTVAMFDCYIRPTPALSALILDNKIDVLSEVGLMTDDGVLFLRRTLWRIPYDPIAPSITHLTFGVRVGDSTCDVFSPELELFADAV
jgi:hypothetical protein